MHGFKIEGVIRCWRYGVVGVWVGLGSGVLVALTVGLTVGVLVGLGSGVFVGLRVGLGVGVSACSHSAPASVTEPMSSGQERVVGSAGKS